MPFWSMVVSYYVSTCSRYVGYYLNKMGLHVEVRFIHEHLIYWLCNNYIIWMDIDLNSFMAHSSYYLENITSAQIRNKMLIADKGCHLNV